MVDRDQILRDIGARVRTARVGQRLSQRALAVKLGIEAQSRISDIECGKAGDVGIGTLVRLAEALDTTVAQLVVEQSAGDGPQTSAVELSPQVEVTVSVPSGTVTIKAGESMAAVSAEALRTLRTAREFGDTAPAAGQIP